MSSGGRNLLVGLGKFIAVVAAGLAVGAALGFGLSELSGSGNDGQELQATAPAASATAAPADAKATILGVMFEPARSASGKARKRARLSVRVRVTNGGRGTLTIGRPALVLPAGTTKADPKADDAFAGALLEPIAAGAMATGVLRFETAGAVTRALAAKQPATLQIAGEKLTVRRYPGR